MLELGARLPQPAEVGVVAIGGAHAIAHHREPQTAARVEHPVGAELRNDVELPVLDAADGGTGELRAVVDLEQGHAEVQAVADQHHAGRVGGTGQGILGQGDDHAAHAFGLDAVAMGKGALGRLGDLQGEQARGKHAERGCTAPLVVMFVHGDVLQAAAKEAMKRSAAATS
ncbi:hypothetical protein D3C78_1200790 [compost metagenome]